MSSGSAVEEVLTRTLHRAGELAVPEGSHVPFPVDGNAGSGSVLRIPTSVVRRSTHPRLTVAVTGVAAAVIIAVGLAVLVGSSPPIPAQRLQLSAARGQQLLCGGRRCPAPVPGSVGSNSASRSNSASGASAASPTPGPDHQAPPAKPRGTWIVAVRGEFVRVITGSAVPGPSASIYLSAGGGRYYRFVTGRMNGPLRVVGHDTHTVTLKAADGRHYVLDLRSARLDAQR